MKIWVDVDEGRGPVMVKLAESAAEQAQLAEELAALLNTRHAGVTRLAHTIEGPDSVTELRLVWIGPHSMATMARPTPTEAGDLVAAVAETIADLHDRGVSHGRVCPEHVVIGTNGVPVLCGVRLARPADADAVTADVTALALLLQGLLLDGSQFDMEPIPEYGRLRRQPTWQGYKQRSLLLLIDQALTTDTQTPPTARAFARSIRDTLPPPDKPRRGKRRSTSVPRAEHPAELSTVPRARIAPGRDRPLRPTVMATAVLALILIAGGIAYRHVRPPAGADAARRVPATGAPPQAQRQGDLATTPATGLPPASTAAETPPTSERSATADAPDADGPNGQAAARSTTTGPGESLTVEPGGTAAPEATHLPVQSCEAVSSPAADVDGDGCPDAIRIDQGGAVTARGTKYQIGRRGDIVVVAAWQCQAMATPALLRPSTGEVFVFPAWARDDTELTVQALALVRDAIDIRAEDSDQDGCVDIVVDTVSGPPSTISVGSANE